MGDEVDANLDPELAQAIALSRQASGMDGAAKSPEVVDLTNEAGGDDLQATLLASIQTAQGRTPVISSDPTTLERQGQIPVGLKNVGNTCYLNSLIQTYFMMPVLRKAVISYKPAPESFVKTTSSTSETSPSHSATTDSAPENQASQNTPTSTPSNAQSGTSSSSTNEAGISAATKTNSGTNAPASGVAVSDIHSHEFMLELQKLFCAMLLSTQRFVDPSNLLKKIVDEQGKVVNIGAQEDVSEFNDIFMMRLQKGLDLAHPPLSTSASQDSLRRSSSGIVNPNHPGEGNKTTSSSANAMDTDSPPQHPLASATIEPPTSTSTTQDISMQASPADADAGAQQMLTMSSGEPGLTGSLLLYPDQTDLTNARLQRMFQPRVLEVVKAVELDGTPIVQEQTIDFGRNFILPVTNPENELYSSLDQFMSDEVTDWETPKKAKVPATRWRWLRRAPEVLFFQQQRAVWSGESFTKANHMLKFPEELYMDRYNVEHSAVVTSIRAENAGRFAKVAELSKAIEPYVRYNNEGTPLDAVLSGSIRYLEALSQTKSPNADQIELMNKSITLLRECQESEAKTLKELQAEKANLETCLESSFASLQSEPYVLYAVWVHAGAANGGHYWAYIKDAPSGEWYKFNDTDITRVDLPKVLEDGYGGQGVTSAYFLIYMKQSLYERSRTLAPEMFEKIVPSSIRSDIDASNAEFSKKLKEHRENGLDAKIERFVTTYKNKITQTQEYAQKHTMEKDMRYYSVFAYLLSRGMEEDMRAAVASEMWLRAFGSGIGKSQNSPQFERLLTQETPGTAVLFKAVALNETDSERARKTQWDAAHAEFRNVFMFTQQGINLLLRPDTGPSSGLTEKQDALRHLFLAYIRNLNVKPQNCKRTDLSDLIQLAVVLCLREAIDVVSVNMNTAINILDDVTYVILRLSKGEKGILGSASSTSADQGEDPSNVLSEEPIVSEGIRALVLDACFTSFPEGNMAFTEDARANAVQDKLIGETFPNDKRWESYAVPAQPSELDQWETLINTTRDNFVSLRKKHCGLIMSYGLPELDIFKEKASQQWVHGQAGAQNPPSTPEISTQNDNSESIAPQTNTNDNDKANEPKMDTSTHSENAGNEQSKMAVDSPASQAPQNPTSEHGEDSSDPKNSESITSNSSPLQQSAAVQISDSNAMDIDPASHKQ